MPGGRVYTTENGCFAKTFGLDPEYEPVIYNATTKPDAYLENVSVDAAGKVDFFDTSYTKNGRTTWPFSYVDPWPADRIPPASFLLILNRNENIVPGVARLDRAQAAAYFMLGETTGTSAGGKDEEGKFLRVPGTNPNVSVDAAGKVDFFDTSHTKNGRTTWPFAYVDPWPADRIPPASFLLILNRNENIVPGVARLDPTQAAAYFMLGETTGTSAGGKDEEGKFLRVPGTNPFFPRDMADMGNRMLELLNSHELQAFVLNTGRVGGGDGHPGSKKVTIPYSSAIVQGIVEGTIEWTEDPDFGYEVAAAIPGVDDLEILQPRRLYERQGRTDEHEAMVARLKRERKEFLGSFPGLDESLVKSLG